MKEITRKKTDRFKYKRFQLLNKEKQPKLKKKIYGENTKIHTLVT